MKIENIERTKALLDEYYYLKEIVELFENKDQGDGIKPAFGVYNNENDGIKPINVIRHNGAAIRYLGEFKDLEDLFIQTMKCRIKQIEELLVEM